MIVMNSRIQPCLVLSVPLFNESSCTVLKVMCDVISHYEMSRFLILCFFLFFLGFLWVLESRPFNDVFSDPTVSTPFDSVNMHSVTMLEGMTGKLRTARFSWT